MDNILHTYKHACGYVGEVLESEAKLPYRARIVAANGYILFWTENFAAKESLMQHLEKLGFVAQTTGRRLGSRGGKFSRPKPSRERPASGRKGSKA